jgi:hypothetical protein
MKKLALVIAVIAALCFGLGRTGAPRKPAGLPAAQAQVVPAGQSDALRTVLAGQKSGTEVTGAGIVKKVLADDNEGSRHQRFILTLSSGQTVLVAHNIDIAPRVDALKPGDSVEFKGIYEANAKGGIIHWTHHDPGGRHPPGWLRHAGRTYQ